MPPHLPSKVALDERPWLSAQNARFRIVAAGGDGDAAAASGDFEQVARAPHANAVNRARRQ
jgi:hypothetical protein